MGGGGNVEPNKRLENAQKSSKIHRRRKTDLIFSETKIINGGKFKIQKCAEFGVERTPKKNKPKVNKIENSSVPKNKDAYKRQDRHDT